MCSSDLTAAADRGHVLETYRPGSGEIALRAWALAPGGNCADFRFAVLQPNGNPTGLAGSIPAGGFADIRLPTWLWGAGSYRVELTYAGANATALPSGKATYSIAVGQSLPPRILQHPSPSAQRVAAGSAAAFTAAAADAVSYQWFKDGTALPGSTGATLTLGTVSTGHAGVYLVQAINAAGRTTSDPAILEVTAGPWTDSDGDGAPDSIERLLGLNAAQPAAADSTNATLRLRIHQP